MDDVVTITQENITLEEGSQVVGFQVGDQVTMDQLVHCLLVYSGNDAASAIATHVGGSTENFVAMMNEYAAQLDVQEHILQIHMVCRTKIIIQHRTISISC